VNPTWFVAVPALGLAAGCLIGCIAILTTADRHRVPVPGEVLKRTRWRRPPLLMVSYPAPGHEGLFRAQLSAGFVLAGPGQPITVYVNPADPHDVSLGPGSWNRVWALLLGLWALMAAAFAVRVLTL